MIRFRPALACLWFAFAPSVLPAAEAHEVMQQAVREFVEETGYEIVGVGSWISGKNYKPGVSDHDLRLIMRGDNVSPRDAERAWKSAREKLTKKISEAVKKDPKLKAKLPQILEATNFYPPDQMMDGVPDMEKAWVKFKKSGTFPNLGAEADKAKIEAAEGLYGNGAKLWRQKYEQKAGSWFYKGADGAVSQGSVQQVHAAERMGKASIDGSANTAAQWVEHAWDELRHGKNGKTMGKYLQRMGSDIDQAIKLGHITERPAWLDQAKALGGHLQRNPGEFAKHEALVRELLDQGYKESAMIAQFAQAGPKQRQFLRMVRQSCLKGARGCLADKIMDAVKSTGRKIPWAHAIQLAAVAMDVGTVNAAKTETERAEAIYSSLAWTAGIAPGVLSLVVEYGRAEAESLGYDLLAKFEDVWNMMEGDFRSRGKSESDISWPLERLVKELHDEEQVDRRVEFMATRAAKRGFGEVTGEKDAAYANRLYEKALPVVLDAWRSSRAQIARQLDLEMQLFAAQPLTMTYYPLPAYIYRKKGTPTGWETLRTSVKLAKPKRLQTLENNLDKILDLVGETTTASTSITLRWSGGEVGNDKYSREFDFDKPGDYTISGTLIVDTIPTKYPTMEFPDNAMFVKKFEMPISVVVRVLKPDTDGEIRTAYYRDYTPPHKEGDCDNAYDDFLVQFDFPVGGGEITNFKHKWGFRSACEDCVFSCVGFTWKSYRMLSGTYEGGDGGVFRITYLEGIGNDDDDLDTEVLAGVLYADGKGTLHVEDVGQHTPLETLKLADEEIYLTFAPF